jgi:hypothetical protein
MILFTLKTAIQLKIGTFKEEYSNIYIWVYCTCSWLNNHHKYIMIQDIGYYDLY